MSDQRTLIQTRITDKQAKKLDKAQKSAGFVNRAEFLRQIISDFLKVQDEKEKN